MKRAQRVIFALATCSLACPPAAHPEPDASTVAATIDGAPVVWAALAPRIAAAVLEMEDSCARARPRGGRDFEVNGGCGEREAIERAAEHEVLQAAIDERVLELEARALGIDENDASARRRKFVERHILVKVEVTVRDMTEVERARDEAPWSSDLVVHAYYCAHLNLALHCRDKLLELRNRWIVHGQSGRCPVDANVCTALGHATVFEADSLDDAPEVRAAVRAAGAGRVTMPFSTPHGYAIALMYEGPRPSAAELREYDRWAIVNDQRDGLLRARLRELRVKYRVGLGAPRPR